MVALKHKQLTALTLSRGCSARWDTNWEREISAGSAWGEEVPGERKCLGRVLGELSKVQNVWRNKLLSQSINESISRFLKWPEWISYCKDHYTNDRDRS